MCGIIGYVGSDEVVPVILGDHVTTEAGTGAVHTAPGHGEEDFQVGRVYGLPVNNPVGGDGRYLENVEIFAGEFVWAANDHVLDVMRENGSLLRDETFEHSYPHCWRHKSPTAFRVTPQWFISMEKAGLRNAALAAIGWLAWQRKIPFLRIADGAAIVTPVGLFFGRIANFINGELYGRPWDGPWAMRFPCAPAELGEPVTRHPSQLYEAALEGLVLGLILFAVFLFGLATKMAFNAL